MTIYLDISAAAHSRAGLGRYAASLAMALDQAYPGRFSLFYNRDRQSASLSSLSHLPTRTVHAGYKPWRLAVWMGQLLGVGFDRLVPGAELYHATEHLLPPLRHCPTVLTVHDLIYRLLPQHHKPLNYVFLNAAMPLFVRRAKAIITISESSKRDLVAHYRVHPDKIHVIYEAAAPGFSPPSLAQIEQARATCGLPERFLLHVGTIEPRKNLTRLLQALEQLRQQGHDLYLVIVGKKGWLYDDFFRALDHSPARDAVILPGYVPDQDLPGVYGAATATVVASVYEGFGLPILESMASGTPVVCSATSSLPELGGDAARYFDPYSVDDMSRVIGQVVQDAELENQMRERGFSQAARFSWTRAAKETMAVYEQLIAKK